MDKLAVIQSAETVAELKEIDTKTKELVSTFHSLVEITDKINYGFGKGTPKEYIKAINEAAAIQKKYEQALRDVAKAQSEVEKLQKKIEFAMTSEGKQVASLKLQLADLNRENKETAKSTSALSSAYDDLNRRHEVARKKAMDLGVTHGIVSKEFLEAAAKANQYEQELKRIDVTLGKFNRNVGNYHGNMFGLNAQMAQVLREMPNFAIDPRIGIMSLTNNLPYLADAIADVSREAKVLKTEYLASAAAAREKAVADALAEGASRKHAAALGAQAEAQVMSNYQAVKAPGIMKQIISSIFSWQSLLIVGISLLMMHSKEIISWTKSLLQSNSATAIAKRNAEDLNNIRKESLKTAAQEITKLDILYRVATNEALSREQRLRATDQLQKLYPSYFKNMTDEQIMLGKSAKQYLSLRDAILASSRARAAEKILGEKQEKLLESQADATDEIQENMLKINKLNAFLKSGKNSITLDVGLFSQDYNRETAKKAIENFKKQNKEILNGVSKTAKNFKKENALIFRQIEKDQQIAAPYEADAYGTNPAKPKSDKKYTGSKLSGEEKDAIDLAIADRDNQIAKIKEQKINLEITEKEYWESYIKIQLKYRDRILNIVNDDNAKKKRISANTRKKAMDELEKANKEIFDYTKKGMDAQRKLEMQELENKMEAIKNDEYILEVERINQQNAVYNRMLDVTNNHYQELIEAAKKYGQEILNIEAERDTKILEIQKSQMGVNANLPKATKSDVEYYQKIEDAYKSAADAEARRNIIANSRLNTREREFLLSLKEAEQTLENLEKDKLRLQEREKELRQKAESNKLTINESEELGNIVDKVSEINENIEKGKRNTEEIKLNKLREDWYSTLSVIKAGFEDLGFSNLASVVDRTFDEIIGKTFDWKDAAILAATAVADALTMLNQTALNSRIAALDEELKVSEERTNQEIGFIEQRLEWLNNLDNATKEQIDERNALEDEARVLKEQQLQREKMIAIQKARAEQRAAAQQALINGALAATKTLAELGIPFGLAPAAVALGFGVLQSGLIMAKDPTPKYFVGRKGGPEEWAWTQEKGREIITDKDGNVKSLGSDKGATLTKLAKGDNVYTAEETQKMLSDLGGISLDSNVFHKIARQGVSPIIIKDKEIDYDKFAGKVGEEFDRTMRKYDKTSFFEDEKGNVFSQDGGKIPVFRGRKKSNIIIINSGKNERN